MEQQEPLDFYFTHPCRVEVIPEGFILGTIIHGKEFVSTIKKRQDYGGPIHSVELNRCHTEIQIDYAT